MITPNLLAAVTTRRHTQGRRWLLWITVTVVCLGVCIELTTLLLDRRVRLAVTENGAVGDFHQVKAFELERDVREHVPLGSTLIYVEYYLTKERMRFGFDASSQAIHASAPYLKDSNFLVYQSMGLTFHFDATSKLTSIDARVYLTGP